MHAFNKIEEGNPVKGSREVSSKITGHVLSNEKIIKGKKKKKKKLIVFVLSIMKTTGIVINQLYR